MSEEKTILYGDKVVDLTGTPLVWDVKNADPNVIEVVEMLMQHAKGGKIKHIAYIAIHDDDSCSTSWYANKNGLTALIGGCDHVKYRMNKRSDEENAEQK